MLATEKYRPRVLFDEGLAQDQDDPTEHGQIKTVLTRGSVAGDDPELRRKFMAVITK